MMMMTNLNAQAYSVEVVEYERMLEREKEYEPYSEYGRGKAVRYVRY